jgi:hypothetical protein
MKLLRLRNSERSFAPTNKVVVYSGAPTSTHDVNRGPLSHLVSITGIVDPHMSFVWVKTLHIGRKHVIACRYVFH